MIALGRRRLVGGAALAVLSVGIWSAQAGTTAVRSTGTTNLFARLDEICRYAAPGTYGLPGHYCESPDSILSAVNGESVDRQAAEIQQAAIASAPDGFVPAGAMASAISQRDRLAADGAAPEDSYAWTRNGQGPLEAADAGYGGVNALGLVELGGRVTSFAYDATRRTVYASSAGGGVFASRDGGAHWSSVGDTLPTTVIGGVAYSPAGHGVLVVVTGDGSFGRYSLAGAGVFRSTDLGRTWQQAKGAPSDAFGFKVVVDPSNPDVVYAATGAGLYRSQDAGASFTNVKLPTGACAGRSNRVKGCLLANVVTDVTVEAPGGSGNAKGGRVLAAVGWRHGQFKASDGTVESPNNGIYTSPTGRPGTFTKSPMTGFTPQASIGRIGLGEAYGPAQDHDYVYATVQNAKGGTDDGLPDSPDVSTPVGTVNVTKTAQAADVLEGVYVSPDFGKSWVKMADGRQLGEPTTGSALAVTFQVLGGYGAGVQSWYNNWIQPDPTRAVGGVPTRLLFGLEEVWENDDLGLPQDKPTHFKVIGRYFSGTSCLGLDLTSNVPQYVCPTNRQDAVTPTTTTHPDQHAVLFLPDGKGGVQLLVGNDGGVFTQRTSGSPADDFANDRWGNGANRGLDTLLPYNVARAKDGTIWMGLQDNGSSKIQDVYGAKGRLVQAGRQIETIGGDGFFVGVDPDNSNRAYSEYVGGAMSGTSDGGRNWSGMSPPVDHTQFSTPFAVDPLDPNHVVIAGREVVESGSGPSTGSDDWATVFDLGTAHHPGSSKAQETSTDAANSQTAVALQGNNAYVGYCGSCDVLEDARPFRSGIATNVGGSEAPKRFSRNGWHIAKAIGLPERFITSIAIDPKDPRIVYVTVGSYQRRWAPPGTVDKATYTAGHLFKSVDAGEHFVDISGDLPNAPANWVTVRGSQLVVADDLGVFASSPAQPCATPSAGSCSFEVLGKGLPAASVVSMQLAPWDCNLLTVASYGRGAWTYRFGPPVSCGAAARTPVLHPLPFANALLAGFDFESGTQGWTTRTTDTHGAEQWRRGNPGHSGAYSFQVVPYVDQTTATLESPRLHLAHDSTVVLSWWKAQRTEACCDSLAVDWSSDGYIWHNVSTKTTGTFPTFSQDRSAKFAAPAGDFYIRFRLTSDQLISSPVYQGVLVDDVEIRR